MNNKKVTELDISFPEYYAKQSAIPFYIAFGLFVFSNMLLVVNFTESAAELVGLVRMLVDSILLILCTMYIAFSLLLWRLKAQTAILAVVLITAVGFGWNFLGQTNEFFCTAVALLLALLAYKKDFNIILKIVLLCHVVTVLVGALGLVFGYSELAYKMWTIDYGFSLGLVYPNHVGRMFFLIYVIIWYLWLQEKPFLSTLIGCIIAVFMWEIVKSKTITIFMVGFPVIWWLYLLIDKRTVNRLPGLICKIRNALFIPMPFLCMLFTYIMGRNRFFFKEHWHMGQQIYSLWMRFISAGVLFDVYGFPLLGRNIQNENAPVEVTNGEVYVARIVDNAYAYYLIAIGGIALIVCMLWISFANYRAIKNADYALLLISIVMSVYGIIEIVFFQFEHNFIFFYPLKASAMAYREKTDIINNAVTGTGNSSSK